MTALQVHQLSVVDLQGYQLGTVTLVDLVRHNDPGADPIFTGRACRRWWELPPMTTARDVMSPVRAIHLVGAAEIGENQATHTPLDAA
jgi:hypothetical protein